MGLTVGVATVVALMAITSTMKADVSAKLDEYGANILIVPKANDLALSYGGVTVASAAYDVGELTVADLDQIKTALQTGPVCTGIDASAGFFTRPERVILIAIGLFTGQPAMALAVLTTLSIVTTGQRLFRASRAGKTEKPR